MEFCPTASVVICTCRRADYLRQCLAAVTRLDRPADDVLVVDNTPGDKDTELAAKDYGVRYLVEPKPGLSRARNLGLAECTTDIVTFLDDDAEPEPDWLRQILEPFKDGRVGAVTGETVPTGFDRSSYQPSPARVLHNQVPQWFEIATFGGLGLGTNMALRKAACEGWKVFDERLGRGAPFRIAEESHAFASMLSRGNWAVHQPSAVVVHPSKPIGVEQEAACAIAYWLLLFTEFPGHRMDLLRFLGRRLRQKPLTWPRNPQDPGAIISSGWRVRVKASIAGMRLYLRSRKLKNS